MKKKVICVFSAILALFTVMLSFSSCTGESSGNLKYKEAENGYALYRYEGSSTGEHLQYLTHITTSL